MIYVTLMIKIIIKYLSSFVHVCDCVKMVMLEKEIEHLTNSHRDSDETTSRVKEENTALIQRYVAYSCISDASL